MTTSPETKTDARIRPTLRVDGEGWVGDVRRTLSPHADERPLGIAIELIVVHGVSLPPGEFGGPWVEDLFAGRLEASHHPAFREIAGLRVAPHLLVRRDGEIIQFVSFLRRAWHAGRSQWRKREACNDFSVGIELEGADHVPYAAAQYQALANLVAAVRMAYPAIGDAGLVGHSDIAPGRKTDPGPAFDWGRLGELLASAGYNFRRSPMPKWEGARA